MRGSKQHPRKAHSDRIKIRQLQILRNRRRRDTFSDIPGIHHNETYSYTMVRYFPILHNRASAGKDRATHSQNYIKELIARRHCRNKRTFTYRYQTVGQARSNQRYSLIIRLLKILLIGSVILVRDSRKLRNSDSRGNKSRAPTGQAYLPSNKRVFYALAHFRIECRSPPKSPLNTDLKNCEDRPSRSSGKITSEKQPLSRVKEAMFSSGHHPIAAPSRLFHDIEIHE